MMVGGVTQILKKLYDYILLLLMTFGLVIKNWQPEYCMKL
jgi:hypothetical protein